MYDVVLRARRVITSDGEVDRCIGVQEGRIAAIEPFDARLETERDVVLDDDIVLMPGLVDSHVHVNEPGRTEWEGFATATRAAAAGGVTTIVDMPLNSIPPTIDVAALDAKRAAADGQAVVDVAFWGGAVPGNLSELHGLYDAGVVGFKCFLAASGVDEFPHLDARGLDAALSEISSFGGLMVVHAEAAHVLEHAPSAHGRWYREFLASRPRRAENVAIGMVIDSSRRTGCRVHLVHLSSSDELSGIAKARREGVPVTVETCPHYLTFCAEEIADGATQFKCCPPIREAGNRELLWRGLADGTIDCVVSDHSPCTPESKGFDTGDFDAAWGGIASLELGLPAVWTQARRRGRSLTDVARWMAERPARIAGLTTKGQIAVGLDADFCVFAPDEAFVVDQALLRQRHPVTPYDGMPLAGVVRSTWLRGELLDQDGPPRGQLLMR
jgi:allantoinase